MKTAMLGLLAETPIHPGAGRGMGVVDLPVAREAATDYPVLVGSSLKGALRDKAVDHKQEEHFGTVDRAGDLLVSDARLLLLPVRSLSSAYRWATCPHLVERYRRDLARAGLTPPPQVPQVDRGKVLSDAGGAKDMFLEERKFDVKGRPSVDLIKAIEPLVLSEDARSRLSAQVAVLHNDDFAWFARYGLSIQARNKLSDGKQSENLWYEESLPPDTVMYALTIGRTDNAIHLLHTVFPAEDPYLQAGGNETVGQGWFSVTVRRQAEGR